MSTVARPIGELDLHLFGEGTHRRLWELLGPQGLVVDAHGDSHGVRFAVWAPNASLVSVVGDWNGWSPEPLKMIDASGPTGIWSGLAPAARTGQRYKFEIITAQGRTLRKADPMARQTELPPSDASVIPSGSRHEWHDDAWMSQRGATIRGDAPLRT
jgi:1,4-alpha-glucan branching enzyme